jgi:hypothetical protein
VLRALPLTGLVVACLTGAVLAAGLLVAPSVHPASMPVRWSVQVQPTPDDSLPLGRFKVGTLGEYQSTQPVVTDGARSLELGLLEGHQVLGVWKSNGALVVALEFSLEGPGPAIELLISTDDGASWLQRTVPKPSYLATVEEVTVQWPQVAITLSLDDAAPIEPAWRRWPVRWMEALAGQQLFSAAGTWRAVSTDGAATFRLSGP